MSGRRVAILDGAVSLFESELPSSAPATEGEIGLVRIPQLREMVEQVVGEIAAADAKKAGSLVMVDKGIVCGVDDVRQICRALHDKIMERLLVAKSESKPEE